MEELFQPEHHLPSLCYQKKLEGKGLLLKSSLLPKIFLFMWSVFGKSWPEEALGEGGGVRNQRRKLLGSCDIIFWGPWTSGFWKVSSVMKSELYESMWDLLKRKMDFRSRNFSHKGFTWAWMWEHCLIFVKVKWWLWGCVSRGVHNAAVLIREVLWDIRRD